MGNVTAIIEREGVKRIGDILHAAHKDAVYYVDEWNDHFKVHGYCADKCIVGVHNQHTHYKLDELRAAFQEAVNPLKVGQKVKFAEEKTHRWTVRAVRGQFAILTAMQFGKIWYTIIDFVKGIRGPDNCYGIGYETDEDIANAMLALHGEHPDGHTEIEVSHRHKLPLSIAGVK